MALPRQKWTVQRNFTEKRQSLKERAYYNNQEKKLKISFSYLRLVLTSITEKRQGQ